METAPTKVEEQPHNKVIKYGPYEFKCHFCKINPDNLRAMFLFKQDKPTLISCRNCVDTNKGDYMVTTNTITNFDIQS